jgi:EmrB/QacA subfamily drug resistance transporter
MALTTELNYTIQGHPKRWFILAILTLSLVMIVASVSSLNLAIPSIQKALDASASELVWINAAYALVFAALLLPGGAIGDRFGRRGTLQVGLFIFIIGALLGSTSSDPFQLIFFRASMGIGAALVMPATLSIISIIFPPEEKGKAIAIWSGFAGAGAAIGIISAGLLLEKFWWGSIFFINVPTAGIALLLVTFFVPTSRDSHINPLDLPGSLLSAIGLTSLVYGLIQGPEFGWTDPIVMWAFIVAVVVLVGWVLVELNQNHPMLDPRLFKIRRFGMGSFAILIPFTVMFGFFFGLSQYLQYVQMHSPLGAALRTLPFALTMLIAAPRGPTISRVIGEKGCLSMGLLFSASGCLVLAFLEATSSYLQIAVSLVLTAFGMAITFPTATAAIINCLPSDKAGVASAVNDTTREVGAAIGIAFLGSLLSAGYRNSLGDSFASMPDEINEVARNSVGAALQVAERLSVESGQVLAQEAKVAFTNGFSLSMSVGSGMLLLASVIVFLRFPNTEKNRTAD